MERKGRLVWWGILLVMVLAAIWKLFLPHGSNTMIEKNDSTREIIVYVTGAVEKPELIHLPIDARLNDALKQVNPLPEANLEQLNPAEKLKDGQKITIPYKPVPQVQGQSANMPSGLAGGTGVPVTSIGAGLSSSVTPSGASGSGTPSTVLSSESNGKININTAGISELDKLPGIGPALAERILQYRNENGPFLRPEDLKKVSGIGDKTYERMASMVSVGP